jgi:hypothetical protein
MKDLRLCDQRAQEFKRPRAVLSSIDWNSWPPDLVCGDRSLVGRLSSTAVQETTSRSVFHRLERLASDLVCGDRSLVGRLSSTGVQETTSRSVFHRLELLAS